MESLTKRHPTLVAYDVTADATRRKVAAALAAWGEREQKSLFTLRISHDRARSLTQRLDQLMNGHADRILLVPLCDGCAKSIVRLGHVADEVESLSWWALT